jgi:hypothetical protein
VGPYYKNNSEAVRFQGVPVSEFKSLSVVNVVEDGQKLSLLMEIIHGASPDIRLKIRNLVMQNKGASEALVNVLIGELGI